MATIERSAIFIKKENGNEIWYYPITTTENVISGESQLNEVLETIETNISNILNGTTFDTSLNASSSNAVQNKVIYVALGNKVDKVDGKELSSNDFTDALLTKLNGIATGATKVTVDTGISSTSANPVQNKAVYTALGNKVDKVDGKELSSNDFTDALLTKLNGIADGADKTTVDAELDASSANPVQNKIIYVALSNKVDKVSGKDLSTNDFTDALLSKLEGIADGATKVIVDSSLSSTSANPVQNKAVYAALGNKVDKVDGKELSSNDFTDALLTKLNGIADGANKTTVDSTLSSTSTNPVQNKVVNTALGNKVDKVDGKELSSNDFTDALLTKLNGIATGATKVTVDTALSSTSANPVQNKAVYNAINDILTRVNGMIADAPEAYDTFKEISDFLSTHQTEYEALLAISNNKVDKVDGKELSSNDFTDALLTKLNGIADGANKTTVDSSMSSTSTNPVQNKVVNTALSNKVDKVSGMGLSANDFTDALLTKLNGIADGANKTTVDSTLSSTSTNPVQNKVVNTALGNKVDKVDGKELSSNDFTDALLTKLNGIATGATKVTVDTALSSTSANPVQNKAVYNAINDILTRVNGMIADAPEAYDTFKEISDFLSTHQTEYEALLAISNNKVDKVDGKELSSNDFTDALLTKLNGIADGANKTTVDSSMSSTSTNPVQNKVINTALGNKVDKVDGKGLSSNDFTDALLSKLNATNTGYGTCSTEAATAAKVITVIGNTNWVLSAGSIITIKFSATNTASNPTFNVNGTGAKSVWYGTALITTSSLSYAGYANRPSIYMYDGTQYVFLGWSYDANTTYTNVKLGHGYATCSTAEATVAKVGTLSSYTLTTGGIVVVKFTYAVPASATLNINSKGAKAIYHKGAAIAANIIKAGDTATFIYNGSQYHLISLDRDTTYAHPSYTAKSSNLYKMTVDSTGHVSAASAATSSDISSLLGFDLSIGDTAPSSVTTETYFMEIEEAETVA